MEVYIYTIDAKYVVTGVGRTPEEAIREACKKYRQTNNNGYGFVTRFGDTVKTNKQITDYYGNYAVGPIKVPVAITE